MNKESIEIIDAQDNKSIRCQVRKVTVWGNDGEVKDYSYELRMFNNDENCWQVEDTFKVKANALFQMNVMLGFY